MLKKLMISAAVSALMVSGAMAQAGPPVMDPPKAAVTKADAAPVDATKFISSQSTDQWVFSKFKGTDVLGPDNAQVGDVNDMLFDKSGKIIGLIIGVDKTTMVVTLDSLEEDGLAERKPSKTDRRARVIGVTAKGKKKVAEAQRVTAGLYEEVLAELSEEQQEVLLGALHQLQCGSLAETSPCQQKPRKRAPRA